MTQGDMIAGHETVLAGQSILISPSGGTTEWAIHNIYIPLGATCELYRTDGTTPIKLMNASTSLLSYNYHCNISDYITVKNTGATSITVAYDGLIMRD
jgi:hypothetical protein